jgi:ABC-type transport system involved in cytochrome bd biosynthesis fused ATPase/permease subunit
MGSSRKLFFGAILGAVINTAIVIGNAFLIAAIIVGLIYSHPTLATHITSLAVLWLFRALFTSQFERWASVEASKLKAELRSQVLSSAASVTTMPS